MNLSVELSLSEGEQLEKAAAKLGLRPEELARAAVKELCKGTQDDFLRVADKVLKKNKDLYERLN